MAKTVGSLFSLEARGKFGNAVVFSVNRGIAQARILVTPRNPRTLGQAEARTVMRFTGAAISRINSGRSGKADGIEGTIKEFLVALRVLPNTWNSYFLRMGFPNSRVVFSADLAAWNALEAGPKDLWVAWNAALQSPFDVTVGAPGDVREFESAFGGFVMARALGRAGYLPTIPLLVPPVWDNT